MIEFLVVMKAFIAAYLAAGVLMAHSLGSIARQNFREVTGEELPWLGRGFLASVFSLAAAVLIAIFWPVLWRFRKTVIEAPNEVERFKLLWPLADNIKKKDDDA